GRERESGPVVAVLDAACEDADHALMPGGVVEADAAALADRHLRDRILGLGLHLGLDRAALTVQVVELPRDVQRASAVAGDQALDAEAHVGEAPGRVEPRPEQEPQVEAACT